MCYNRDKASRPAWPARCTDLACSNSREFEQGSNTDSERLRVLQRRRGLKRADSQTACSTSQGTGSHRIPERRMSEHQAAVATTVGALPATTTAAAAAVVWRRQVTTARYRERGRKPLPQRMPSHLTAQRVLRGRKPLPHRLLSLGLLRGRKPLPQRLLSLGSLRGREPLPHRVLSHLRAQGLIKHRVSQRRVGGAERRGLKRRHELRQLTP